MKGGKKLFQLIFCEFKLGGSMYLHINYVAIIMMTFHISKIIAF